MGSWGVTAYENDTAADWVFKKIKNEVDRAIYSPYALTEEVLAALAVAADLNLVPWLAWDRVEAALLRIEADDAKSGWREPEERAKYLKGLAKRLQAGRKAAAWTPLTAKSLKRHKASKSKPGRRVKRDAEGHVLRVKKAAKKAPAKKAPAKKAAKVSA